MPSQTRTYAAAVAEDSSYGELSWDTIVGANAIDSTYEELYNPDAFNEYTSYYLTASDWGFTIPSGSTITGISVKVNGVNGGCNGVFVSSIRLIDDTGSITGTDLAGFESLEGVDITYGSSSNMWGTSLTYDKINSQYFGAAIAVYLGIEETVYFDGFEITVYYSTPSTYNDGFFMMF